MEHEKVRIKICGLTQPEEIGYVNEVRPDFAGFVIGVPTSRRNTTPEQVCRLRDLLAPGITAVGVFVNAPARFAAKLVRAGAIDAVQLHGSEDEEYIRELRSYGKFPVIKAFREETLEGAEACSADLILLDHAAGGTGETFDWELAKKIRRPFLLAGGLGPDNLAEAIRKVRPWGVDMSSRLETAGRKDREKILRAVEIARSLEGSRKGFGRESERKKTDEL